MPLTPQPIAARAPLDCGGSARNAYRPTGTSPSPVTSNCGTSSDRNRLQSLVYALPHTDVQAAISFLAELGQQEIIDPETAAKLDLARAEPGEEVPLEEVRRRLGL